MYIVKTSKLLKWLSGKNVISLYVWRCGRAEKRQRRADPIILIDDRPSRRGRCYSPEIGNLLKKEMLCPYNIPSVLVGRVAPICTHRGSIFISREDCGEQNADK